MFTKIHFSKIVIAGAFFVSYALVAQALSKDDIVYPATELNGCQNETECRAFCDDSANIEVCVSFAKKYSLISEEEASRADKFIAAGAKGPGGCDSAASCETYCNDIDRIDECLAFAERTGLMPPGELEEARKVQAVIKSGAALPGGCRNKNECEAYCESPDNMEECITFGEKAGFIPPEELEEAKKVLAAVKAGAKPPPCRGKAECESYCSEPANFESCIAFAEAAGLIPPEELADAKKMLSAIQKGVKPPACRGKAECDAYCSDESHFEECLTFAEAAGFIAPEEVEMARKTGGKGPGNCKGREECESFCKDPANGETCFNFAKEHDLIRDEDLRRMEEGKQQILQMVDSAPPEVKSCLEGVIDVEAIRSGSAMPREDMGDSIKSCFEQFMPKPEGGGEFGPPPGFEGQMPPSGFEGGQAPPGFEGGQMPPGFEGQMPPEGFHPPEGMMPPEGFQAPTGEVPPEFQQQYQQEFQQQYQQEFQRQSEEQYQQQYQEQYQQQMEQQQQQMQQQYQQPIQEPTQNYTPPPESFSQPPPPPPPPSEPQPTSRTNPVYLLAAPLFQLLGY